MGATTKKNTQPHSVKFRRKVEMCTQECLAYVDAMDAFDAVKKAIKELKKHFGKDADKYFSVVFSRQVKRKRTFLKKAKA